MSHEHHEHKESPAADYRIERNLLLVSTTAEALSRLTQEADAAKEKYYDQGYFYMSDLITNYIRSAQSSLRNSADFGRAYQEAIENIGRLNAAMDHMIRLSSGPLPKAMVEDLGLEATLVLRLQTMESAHILPELERAAPANSDRLAWIAIFLMAKSTANKPSGETSATERALKSYLAGSTVPALLADYDHFSRKL